MTVADPLRLPAAELEPPYFAVIFTSHRTLADAEAYDRMAAAMEGLAARQPGYLGFESARDPATGRGISISYWQSEEAIAAWKANAEHAVAQQAGRERWYAAYEIRVARVERAYSWRR